MSDIKVTCYLSTYNQAPYVHQAIESILMQKTSFRYELIIADDSSTDGTQEIAREYKERYPDIITLYFTERNIGGCKKLTNCIDMGLFKGEYLSYLEGDDYWLNENRLQILTDFLDEHPQYSRVSHRRKVIDELGNEKGYDISDEVLNKPFYIDDFLAGKQYSDFGSVFRNYFKTVGKKYHPLFWASRNVCDFQSMFITQDFGPVFIMSDCFGVYRSRSVVGATNYNSITTSTARAKDSINLARKVEVFYEGKYDLSPMIYRNQKRIVEQTITALNEKEFGSVMSDISEKNTKRVISELLYETWRSKRIKEYEFLKCQIKKRSVHGVNIGFALYGLKRWIETIRKMQHNAPIRGKVIMQRTDNINTNI